MLPENQKLIHEKGKLAINYRTSVNNNTYSLKQLKRTLKII